MRYPHVLGLHNHARLPIIAQCGLHVCVCLYNMLSNQINMLPIRRCKADFSFKKKNDFSLKKNSFSLKKNDFSLKKNNF